MTVTGKSTAINFNSDEAMINDVKSELIVTILEILTLILGFLVFTFVVGFLFFVFFVLDCFWFLVKNRRINLYIICD